MNATTTEQVTSRTDEWYTQLYLSIVDTLIGQLNMRFPQEMFAIARAVGAVFSCVVKGVDPLIRHYGSLLNINLPVLQAEMTLSGSTADAVSLEVIRSELNQHAVAYP